MTERYDFMTLCNLDLEHTLEAGQQPKKKVTSALQVVKNISIRGMFLMANTVIISYSFEFSLIFPY